MEQTCYTKPHTTYTSSCGRSQSYQGSILWAVQLKIVCSLRILKYSFYQRSSGGREAYANRDIVYLAIILQENYSELIESARRVTADSLDLLGFPGMQSSTHQSRGYGIESHVATTEALTEAKLRRSVEDLDGCTACTVGQADSPETDDLSVPLLARLFGDYSYIYDEYLD